MTRRSWRNSKLSREPVGLGPVEAQGLGQWGSCQLRPPAPGHWPGTPLPGTGSAAAPAAGRAAGGCGRRWPVWGPTRGWGKTWEAAGGLRGCGHGASGGCSSQSPPCSPAHRNAGRLGLSAPAAPPAPPGSGSGHAGQGWGLAAEPPCLLVSPGGAPVPTHLEIDCGGREAVSGRQGCLWSAAG